MTKITDNHCYAINSNEYMCFHINLSIKTAIKHIAPAKI